MVNILSKTSSHTILLFCLFHAGGNIFTVIFFFFIYNEYLNKRWKCYIDLKPEPLKKKYLNTLNHELRNILYTRTNQMKQERGTALTYNINKNYIDKND